MKYYPRIIQNEIVVEVQIARDDLPGAGYISARKRLEISLEGKGVSVAPGTVWVNAGFAGIDLPLDEIDNIQRWFSEAAKMARLLDDCVKTPADFTGAVYEVRQVAGTLILDKRVKEPATNA
jgi:hypothetical protein